MLSSKQQLLDIPKHRWNSTHDMIKRLWAATSNFSSVALQKRSYPFPEERRNLEDISELLEPYKNVTTYLSAESYLTISALGALFAAIPAKLVHWDIDLVAVRNVKSLLAADMSMRYQGAGISLLIKQVPWIHVSKYWHICQLLSKKRQLITSFKTFAQISVLNLFSIYLLNR